ncbi:MAG TPA: serine protease [Desulfobacteraceae bacterium]|nr:serine protease [Desulfobacteraceae bacterium]
MSEYLLPIVFQILGALVVVAEVFIPSMGMLSAIALGLVGYSLYLAYTDISPTVFFVFLGIDIFLLPVFLVAGLKLLSVSPLSLNKKLSAEDGVVSQAADMAAHLGKKGHSLTALRPSGTAMIDGRRLDVVTDGDFVEAKVPVEVTGVTGNQIIVSRIEE